MQLQQITLVGVGLLGGSLGLAAKKRGLAERVLGLVRRPESVAECLDLAVVDEATLDVECAIKDADLIIHCAPISQMRALSESFLPFMKKGVLVTDVGSVKGCVVEELEELIAKGGGHFVGSHPMAGGEQTGVAHSRADLFHDAAVVITPTGNSNAEAVERVCAFWKALGSRILSAPPSEHDKLVARSSHLPHVAAAALTTTTLRSMKSSDAVAVCGPGFRDATRIASGSPSMWRDIVQQNAGNVSRCIDELIRELEAIKQSLDARDPQEIEAFFQIAKDLRDQWNHSQSSSAPREP